MEQVLVHDLVSWPAQKARMQYGEPLSQPAYNAWLPQTGGLRPRRHDVAQAGWIYSNPFINRKEEPGMRSHRARFWSLIGAALVVGVAACSSSSSSNLTSPNTKAPILIGASLSFTGDFSAEDRKSVV